MSNSRGNVLFLILIAVALFAALSYAVSSSMRSGQGDTSKESLDLLASQITQYAAEAKNATLRVRISNGCAPEQISFENPSVAGYVNLSAPPNKKCHIFDAAGGNIIWQAPPKGSSLLNYTYVTGISLVNIGTGNQSNNTCSGAGSDKCSELLILLPEVSQDLCRKLRVKLGNPDVMPIPAEDNGPLGDPFVGVFMNSNYDVDNAQSLGYETGCVRMQYGTYTFYDTLIAR